jgi:hypothetical protein
VVGMTSAEYTKLRLLGDVYEPPVNAGMGNY